MTNARASAEILRMVLAELPHSRAAPDMIPVASPEMQVPTCSALTGANLEMRIVRMTEVQAYIDGAEPRVQKAQA